MIFVMTLECGILRERAVHMFYSSSMASSYKEDYKQCCMCNRTENQFNHSGLHPRILSLWEICVTVYVVIFANFASQTSQRFPLQFMYICSNENISKIAKLTPHKFLHQVQNRKNICMQNLWCIYSIPKSNRLQLVIKHHLFS